MHIPSVNTRSLVLIVLLALSACSSITTKPQKPTVELISVHPLNISLTKQKLRFNLKVFNPNGFDMPIDSVDFIARFNDTNIASGKSNQSVTVPANSDAIVSLDVTAGLDRLTSSLESLLTGDTINLDYELKGEVTVATWPRPIPFNVVGAMEPEDL